MSFSIQIIDQFRPEQFSQEDYPLLLVSPNPKNENSEIENLATLEKIASHPMVSTTVIDFPLVSIKQIVDIASITEKKLLFVLAKQHGGQDVLLKEQVFEYCAKHQKISKNQPFLFRLSHFLSEESHRWDGSYEKHTLEEKIVLALEELHAEKRISFLNEITPQFQILQSKKFKEIFVNEDPAMKEFWNLTSQKIALLNPVDSLRFSFLNGATFQLFELAHFLDLTASKLQKDLQEAHQKGFLLLSWSKDPNDRYFEIQMDASSGWSPVLELWFQSQDIQERLLAGMKSFAKWNELLQPIFHFSENGITTQYWQELHSYSEKLLEEDEIVEILGALLLLMEETESSECLLLWSFLASKLELPFLPFEKIEELLPANLAQAEKSFEGLLSALIDNENLPSSFLSFLTELPASFDFKWLSNEWLEKLATHFEEKDDRVQALALREKLYESDALNEWNLRSLSSLEVKNNNIFKGLEWMLAVNRLNPKRFSLEAFLRSSKEFLFSNLEQLRQKLIELPAHPALKEIEEECTQRELLQKTLLPQIDKWKELLKAKHFSQVLEEIAVQESKNKEWLPQEIAELKAEALHVYTDLKEKMATRYPSRKEAVQILNELSEQAFSFGFQELGIQALQKVVRVNPHYGLGFVKLARVTPNKKIRNDAYEQAILLCTDVRLALQNYQEFASILIKEKNPKSLIPLLVQLIQKFPNQPKDWEEALIQLLDKGIEADILRKEIEKLKQKGFDPSKMFRLEKRLMAFDTLEPWKQALFALKTK